MSLPAGAWGKARADRMKAAFYEFLNHCQITSKESEVTILGKSLYDAQIRAIEAIFDGLAQDKHNFKILKSRQLGISTVTRALMLFWSGMFVSKGALVFHTSDALDDARMELLDMLGNMDGKYKFPRKSLSNRNSLTLENNSRIGMLAAGVKDNKGAASLGAGRGLSLVHRSELSSYGNREGLESMRHSLARVNPNRLFVDESTARGANLWKEIWLEAKVDDDCVCIFIGWWSHPDQKIERGTPNFEKYSKYDLTVNEKHKIKEVKELYGHDITAEQLCWIRKEMDMDAAEEESDKKDFSGDPLRVQEQPWCVAAGTRVGTNLGMIRIDTAEEGLIGTLGLVRHAGPTGVSRIWRATTKLGYSVRGTGNHPLIDIDREEVRLDNSLGRVVVLQPPMFAFDEHVVEWREGPVVSAVQITPEMARLVGIYMGDGSLQGAGKNGGAGYFSVACGIQDMDVVEEVQRLIESIFGIVAPGRRQGKTGCFEVRVGSRLVVETFRRLGLARNDTGNTRRKVHVPEFIFRSPKHVVKEFLAGLFEADGFNAYDTYRCALFSKYPGFIADVQYLLLGFGITSRAVSMEKKHPDGHSYTGRQLELRKAEAIAFNEQIGFLSARKKGRHTAKEYHPRWKNREKPTIRLQDEVVSVIDEGVEETVYNLTVEGEHLFDANGILTHNTESEAFQMTGSVFFDPAKLTDQMNKNVSSKFQSYTFLAGFEFTDFQCIPAPNRRSVQLKVWEEPVEDSVYVISCDPAYGINEKNDRSAIQVLRAYSDGLDQVAEYAWPLIDTNHLAWVIAALEAWYGGERSSVYRIIELNGPGDGTWRELLSLKQKLQNAYFGTQMVERGLQNMQKNVKNYFYARSDQIRPGQSYHWKTTVQTKVSILERLRDYTHNGTLRIRSIDTLEEMRSITRAGDSIGADGNDHDDRVFALAMAARSWEDYSRRLLMQMRRTRDSEAAKRRMTVTDLVQTYNTNQFGVFLAGRSSGRQAQLRAAQYAAWRGR